MAELIVSYMIHSHHGKPYGYRISSDGTAEMYRVSKTVKNASGTMEDQAVTPGWYRATTLSAAQVDSLRQAVADSGLASLPGHIRGGGTGSTAGRGADWEVSTAEGVKTISIDHWPPVTDPAKDLLALSVKIGGVVGEALASGSGSST